MLSNFIKSTDWRRVAQFTLFYLCFSWFLVIYNYVVVTSPHSLGPNPENSLRFDFFAHTIMGLIAGIAGGTILVYVNNTVFRLKSYGYALSMTAAVYATIFILSALVIANTMAFFVLGFDSSWAERLAHVHYRLLQPIMIAYFFIWGGTMVFTLFMLQVNDKFGPGVLWKFLKGQYFQPLEEPRFFMFLDMRSSTTIAEAIGHTRYFNLIREVFSDITNSIISCKGEIYQYVGDEVIISWSLEDGKANANCIRCFQQVEKTLEQLAPKYEEKYGLVPTFKAGIHFGEVTAGEIGSIKKDIVYSGDVLNTTARIQGQCNKYEVNLLVSQNTIDALAENFKQQANPLGKIELRGKQDLVEINSISFSA